MINKCSINYTVWVLLALVVSSCGERDPRYYVIDEAPLLTKSEQMVGCYGDELPELCLQPDSSFHYNSSKNKVSNRTGNWELTDTTLRLSSGEHVYYMQVLGTSVGYLLMPESDPQADPDTWNWDSALPSLPKVNKTKSE
jgi:hypothetical protein